MSAEDDEFERPQEILRNELAQPQPLRGGEHRLARFPLGVLYQGEFETPWDGTGVAVRLHARALGEQGVPLLLRSFSNMVINAHGVAEPVHVAGLSREVMDEVGAYLTTEIAACAPAIKHLVISGAERLRRQLLPIGAVPFDPRDIVAVVRMRTEILGNTIVYCVWERDRIAPEIAELLRRVWEVWVPCEQNAIMLRECGITRVQVIPHPYVPDDLILRLAERSPAPNDTRRFYSIGRWEPRKGFAELIQAFLAEFGPDDRAALTIKYTGDGTWKDYPTPEQAIEEGLRSSSRGWTREAVDRCLTLIDGRIRRSKILELHFKHNIYVSASHGEAFGLPAFEAKLAGNRLVHVPFGGTADFATTGDHSVPYHLGPVHASYGWELDSQWAHYHPRDLRQALRSALPPDRYDSLERHRLLERHSLSSIGAQMKDRVQSFCATKGIHYTQRTEAERKLDT